jgi:hypothetical protein
MTIDPQYPVVTRGTWHLPVQDHIELELTLKTEANRLAALSKTNNVVRRSFINDTGHHYVYRFWADTETAENWIEFCKIIPAECMESISIVDSSEVLALHEALNLF